MERAAVAQLPIDGEMPELDGATAWLNSEPLTADGLRGKVVVVQFCTFSCVNWIRTLPHVRAWERKYRDAGLVVIGAHSPEFPFEHDVEKVEAALGEMGVEYPVAIDNDFAVWRAFANQAWPALYFVDAEGRIRHSHFGEEDYERSERVIQQLLAEAGHDLADHDLVSVERDGVELPADWDTVQSAETYLGYARASGLASFRGVDPGRSRLYMDPPVLELNQWALSGDWTVEAQTATLNEPGGRITFRFHARDLNLVMGAEAESESARFVELIDGQPPNGARGIDVDPRGNGRVVDARMYQLVRQDGPIRDRTFEITFLDPGAQAYVFTFG
jgi:thiol-disulfide isomerase/thioredoxin